MFFLTLVSFIWAFSFGIIGNTLAGVPSAFTSAARLLLAFLLFAPFLRPAPWRFVLVCMSLGAVQFGGMYLAYNEAFKHLASHQVALLTITTPLWIGVLEATRGRFSPRLWQAAALATVGTGLCAWKPGAFPLAGVLLLQLSNICFAFGQWFYRGRMTDRSDTSVFSWMYLGGFLATLPLALPHLHLLPGLGAQEIKALCYLGLIASGLCFFLWNLGVRRVPAARMAVMNDLKIPLGVLASVFIFKEQPSWPRLMVGGILLVAAMWLGGAKHGQEDKKT